jgi:RNA polymerase sigma-70 factor (ECF subfamily)
MAPSFSQNAHEQMTDEQLVQMSLQDEDAFYVLMKRYEPIMLRYIKRMTRISREDAEELLQEIFIKIYRNLNGFDINLKFATWAYRIAYNEIVSQYRKKRRISLTESLDGDNESQPLVDFLAGTLDMEAHYLSREIAAKVENALEELPSKYREILVLRYFEEMSYKEISDVLRKPPGSIATLVNRAKSKFKKIAMRHQLNGLYKTHE